MPWWIGALIGAQLGINLLGQYQQNQANKKSAEAERQEAAAQGWESARKLKQEQANTLSQLTARAGRAGVEVAATRPTSDIGTIYEWAGKKFQYRPGTYEYSGATNSPLMQQQHAADVYEQEIATLGRMVTYKNTTAEMIRDYMNTSSALDVVGTILESGSDLFKTWYMFDRFKIPGSSPTSDELFNWWEAKSGA